MKFHYLAKTIDGKIREGDIEAATASAAADLLRKENLFITSLKSGDRIISLGLFDKFFKRVSLRDKVIFTEQLAVMIQSGFPLVKALRTLQSQAEKKVFAGVIGEVATDVEGGKAFSEALAKKPDVFPTIYIQVARSGEKSGELDKVLLKLAADLSKNYDLIAKIRGALIYPAFIFVSLIAVSIVILIFVIPQLKTIFGEVGVSLPITTRVLIAISDFMTHFWYLVIVIVIGLIFGYYWLRKLKGARAIIDRLKLKIPILGALQKKIYLARFVRTLSTLTSAGLPVLETFKTLEDSINNIHYQKDIREAASKIENGFPIGISLQESKYFPAMICEMITVGEKAGNLDYILNNLAKFLEKDVSYIAKNLTTLLEPVLMLIMGAGVAFIITSVLMPIYGLVQVIK